jgi:hypothetical protein
MAVRVQLNDGLQIVSRMSYKDMQSALEKALARNSVLELESGDGTVRTINPMQVLYVEKIDEATADRLLNGRPRHLSVHA